MDGQNEIAPRRCSPSPGRQVKSGNRSTARLTLPELPRNLKRRTSSSNAGSSEPGSTRSMNVRRESTELRTAPGLDLLAILEGDARRATVLDDDPGDRRLHPDLRAERAGSAADRVGDAAGPALRDAPGPEGAVDLAHVVVKEHVGRAGTPDAEVRADDPAGAHRRLERVRLEPLVEEVRCAHRHQLDEDRLLSLRQPLERPGEAAERHERSWVEAREVRRDDGQDRLDEAGHVDHELAVLLVGLGVVLRPAAQLANRPAVVVDAPQIVAATRLWPVARAQRGERPVEREDVEAVLRELEVADDLRPQEADDIREDAEPEAREELLGHRGATEDVAPLQDERLEAGARQVGRADEAVVAPADDHRVVAVGHAVVPSAVSDCIGVATLADVPPDVPRVLHDERPRP